MEVEILSLLFVSPHSGRREIDMKKIKKIMSLFLAFSLLLSLNFTTVFASTTEKIRDNGIMLLEGPSTTFEGHLVLDENGNYSGQLRSGFTTVTCVLSGRTGGIPTLYTIYIRWKGSNAVQALQADNLYIVGESQYYNRKFFIDGLSDTQGYCSVGTCVIPDEEESVYVSTNNLRCFFYNEDYWIKFNEIGGWVEV